MWEKVVISGASLSVVVFSVRDVSRRGLQSRRYPSCEIGCVVEEEAVFEGVGASEARVVLLILQRKLVE